MKNFIVTFIYSVGGCEHSETVTAADYTKAYLKIIFKYPINIIITALKEI